MKKTKIYRTVRKIYKKLTFTQRNKTLDQRMFSLSVPLSSKHLERCKVFPDRQSMISNFPKNAFIAEVGVAQGNFSADILTITNPQRFILIDAWAMDENSNYGEAGFRKVKERFNNEIKDGTIQIIRGFSHEKLEEIEDNSLDWVYIDAAHDYQSVKNDLEIAFKKVRNGGLISGHDYHRWSGRGMRFGVVEAVNSFCVQKEVSFIGVSLDHNNNWSYALKINK